MASESIELTIRPHLWHTFDRRQLRGLEDYETGKRITLKALGGSQKLAPFLYASTLPNINRYFKLFHS